MSLSTYLIVIGIAVALSTGWFQKQIAYLTENPIPTWLALTIIIPVLLFGLLAMVVGDMQAKERRNESK